MDQWGLLARVAAGQHGLVAVWQVEDLGIARQLLVRRVAEQGWHRVVRGVYLLPGMALTPLARIKAADLALRGRGLASHRTAAFVWGLRNRLVRPLEFVVPPHCTLRVQGVHIRRLGGVLEGDGARHTGVATDRAGANDLHPVRRVLGDRARRRSRYRTPPATRHPGQRRSRRGGLGSVRRPVAPARGAGARRRGAQSLQAGASGTPTAGRHCAIDTLPAVRRSRRGGFVAELDIAFPDYRVGVPIDGPHHFEPDQKRADDDQRHRLHLLDWLLVPADQLRLEHQPRVFVRQVTQALRKKGWSS